MKLFLLLSIIGLYGLVAINAAAVDTVVEKEKDTNQNETTKALLDDVDQDCRQPREIGRCFAIFHRYAFNAESLKCEEFIYGGCGGNENNFETLEECERKCTKAVESHTVPTENDDDTTNNKEDDLNKEKRTESATEVTHNIKND